MSEDEERVLAIFSTCAMCFGLALLQYFSYFKSKDSQA